MQIEHIDLSFRVYDIIKKMILTSELKAGEKIYQEKLAEDLGVSRTPLLKALQMLEQELLVESIPRRGMVVKKISLKEMVDAFYCREGLEGIAARLAAQKITTGEVEELRKLFSPFQAQKIDENAYKTADQKLHTRILEISGNSILKKLEIIGNVQLIIYHQGLVRPLTETLQEHLRIIVALERKDPVAAELNMKLHLRKSCDHIEKML